MTQITITGGTGSFAEFMIKELEGAYDLVLFDRVRPGENRFPFENRHSIVVGDLTDFEACQRAVAGSQAVFHLGAIPFATELPPTRAEMDSGARSFLPFDETMRVNTMGTYYLMEAAQRAGVKTVVMASSCAVLGLGLHLSGGRFPIAYLPIDEEHPLFFEDTYALSKVTNENTLAAFSRAYGLRCYALRPAGIFRPEYQQELARTYVPPPVWNDWLFPYIDSRDLARAFRMCVEAAPRLPPFDVFFVCAPDSSELEDTHHLIERLRPDLIDKAKGLVGRQSLISAAKAERSFGFRAEHRWTDFLPK